MGLRGQVLDFYNFLHKDNLIPRYYISVFKPMVKRAEKNELLSSTCEPYQVNILILHSPGRELS